MSDHPPSGRGRSPAVSRRTLLRGAAVLGAGAVLPGAAAAPAAAASGPAGFPSYRYLRPAFDKKALAYNPTGEFIFPTIRGTAGRLASPMGRYYLYYAPHDAPGGICLAYADSLEGPFTEYRGNPIVARGWSPHHSVSHVSSPHVMWNSAAREMWLYYHGENTTTRLARSTDGVHFRYQGVVLNTGMLPGTTETSYARVFEHPIPARGSRYVMVFMRNSTSNSRSIGWGWSRDGISWTYDREPLVRPSEVGAANISGPHLLTRNNSAYVVYHTSNGGMRVTEVGGDFTRRVHLGAFHYPMSGAPDNGRAAAPSFGTDGGVHYMFYEAGDRLGATIAIAREV
ncbi:hypothetical protein [Actinorugispora endophytica]|uniref:Secreted protein n=1 Tax=Actinorugispora endophytica TaxID=1605990 RepID=A0A4R6UJS2_9ACTN|nr:hypothetical protein [Actinorugispora endophytica]TDQ46366.1 hypothetical protein EV190_12553 [Actinorugispora endophytica]